MTVQPASWLLEHQQLLPRSGRALDVACGRGRHALWLAQRGLAVLAIDRDPDAIRAVEDEVSRQALSVEARVVELERGTVSLGSGIFDLIVVFNYLHRPLFGGLIEALAPGGVLVYETFTTAQAARGKPTNPDFLLKPGELRQLVSALDVLAEREGDFEGRMLASVVARRPRS